MPSDKHFLKGIAMSLDKINSLVETTQNNLFGTSLAHSEISQIDRYVNSIKAYPKAVPYKYTSEETKRICNQIESGYNRSALEDFHKFLLLKLIAKHSADIDTMDMPDEIVDLYKKNFNRIAGEIETNQYKGPYLYSNDKFCKDVALCGMRLIPVGARKTHASILSKRFLLKKGVSQFLDGLLFVLFELKGFKPLYEMHTDSKDPDLLSEFNPDGLKKSYFRIADLLNQHPEIKGIFGTSWFNDPVLETISPRLSYIRRIVVENGGKCFFIGADEHAVKNSTQKSMTRRKLYQEGKYLPTNYLIIWSRRKLIEWAESRNAKPLTNGIKNV